MVKDMQSSAGSSSLEGGNNGGRKGNNFFNKERCSAIPEKYACKNKDQEVNSDSSDSDEEDLWKSGY